MPESSIVGVVAGIFGILAAVLAVISAMIRPIFTRMDHFEESAKEDKAQARGELDKSERGLKELTTRAETIIRQTVEDVDTKLRREAELIEEKTRIQLSDLQRQLEQLRAEVQTLRRDGWSKKDP